MTRAIRGLLLALSLLGGSGCAALFGDFGAEPPNDAGGDGYSGSLSDTGTANLSDGSLPSDGSGADARLDSSAELYPDASGDAGLGDASLVDAAPAPLPLAGEVVFSEVMFDPTPSSTSALTAQNQWLEVYNAASSPRLLNGLTLTDSVGGTHTIASSPWVTVAPHAYALLVNDAAQLAVVHVPAASVAYQYSGITLTLDGGVSLSNGTTVLASVAYGAWALTNTLESSYAGEVAGGSIALAVLDAGPMAVAGAWCISPTAWWTSLGTRTPYGTPGLPNDCDAGAP